MSVQCLSIHADYLCRHSGACCTSAWPIHVESHRLVDLQRAVEEGRLWFDRRDAGAASPFEGAAELPPGAGAVIRVGASGACVFYERGTGLCAIHRSLGHASLPSACQHFPRRCLVETDRTAIALSHYCPTVARLAFRIDVPLAIVPAPDTLAGHLALEGLDARAALPPLVRPNLLADVEGYRSWEQVVVEILARPIAAEAALALVSRVTEDLQAWTPREGSLAAAVERARAARVAGTSNVQGEGADASRTAEDYETVRASVPAWLAAPPLPSAMSAIDARYVAPAWPEFSRPLRHFLAAHAFGSWSAYLGMGTRTVVRSLRAALAVVRVEAALLCADADRRLDEPILLEALRAADLILVHLADPKALAARFSAAERDDAPATGTPGRTPA